MTETKLYWVKGENVHILIDIYTMAIMNKDNKHFKLHG